MTQLKFQMRFGLLILLMAGLFAVPVTMVLNKKDKDLSETQIAADDAQSKKNTSMVITAPPVPGEWVVIDCQQRKVERCPHALDIDGQTPEYPASQTTPVYRGRCRDVSIQIDTFCPR